ncbi:hypothetical protein N7519_008685 [Penicillium mononematosum]|uniref:uncharacterized protein n=1 Tax=Penicillium mononematosum TaxID=268346 RepID=UPI00254834B9|nr:uncharacterized protein N7519_008685 [Penicillium mononematosum]KAJ6178224.1 hypothetical protein N7519_008685 [Penicillium mononematosum]
MADNRATPEPEGNGLNGNKENGDNSPPYAPLETLAAIAVAAAGPSTAPAAAPTIETDEPTVEMVEDIGATTAGNTGGNTGESVQPAPPHASASGHGPPTSAALAYLQRDLIRSRMTHRLSPYLAETPNQFLGQVWINHIDSLLGVRTQNQTDEMRYCVEQADRVVHLANDILRQQRELLAEVRRIVTGGYHSGDESNEHSEVDEFGDEAEGDGDGDGTAANGRSAANE